MAEAAAGDLHGAARTGDVQALGRDISAGADVNGLDKLRRTPLHLAAWAGQVRARFFLGFFGRHTRGAHYPKKQFSTAMMTNSKGRSDLQHLTRVYGGEAAHGRRLFSIRTRRRDSPCPRMPESPLVLLPSRVMISWRKVFNPSWWMLMC